MNEVAVLDANQLNGVGIKTQINQNDLIEVIVQEKSDSFNNEFQRLVEQAKELREELSAIDLDETNAGVNILRKKHNLKEKEWLLIDRYGVAGSALNSTTKDAENVAISYPVLYNSKEGSRKVELVTENTNHQTIYNQVKIMRFQKITTKDGVEEIIVKSYPMSFGKGVYEDVQTRTKRHNKEVKEFVAGYKGVNVDENSILKAVRSTVNKQLIRAADPSLKKKVKELFGVNI